MTPYQTRRPNDADVADFTAYRLIRLIGNTKDGQLRSVWQDILDRYVAGEYTVGWLHGNPVKKVAKDPVRPSQGTQAVTGQTGP